ncbi:uncharacterized protein LOC130625720 [Hydractinia symbiolongicarpus]|uniref:uncharacterized protein LOC130625720 n=1 Tax=Hydractinia symbiolongicarpus TaxID=13093 RepID=UPI00254F2D07|nr:uncharacterized protein LOC130625720 [Hydractinia symbiolongicarpus]
MAASHHALLAKNEYQLRLLAFLNEGADKLRFILHNPVQGNLPNDQTELYKALLPFKKKLNHLGKDQLAIIFPPDQKTNSKLFDITLLCDLLINCTNIQPPSGGWRVRVLKEKDLSTGADILRIKILRNKIIHGRRLDVSEFLSMWDELESVLRRMGYDVSNVKDLKSGCLNNLELFKVSLLKSEFEILKFNYQQDIQQNKQNIELTQQDVQKNRGDLQQTKEDVQETAKEIEGTKQDLQETKTEVLATKIDVQETKQALIETTGELQQTLEKVAEIKDDVQQTKQSVYDNQQEISNTVQDLTQTKRDVQQTNRDVRHTILDVHRNQQNIIDNKAEIYQTKQDTQETKQDVQQTKQDVRQAKEDIQQTKQDLQQTTEDVRQTKLDVQETREDVQQTKLHLRQTKLDVQQTKQDVQQTNQDVRRRTQEIQRDILESRQDLKQGMLQNQREIQRSIIDLRETLKQSERKSENLHDHDERNDRADESYSIYTNCKGKIIVKLAKVIKGIQLEIHSDDDGSIRVLQAHVDFMEKVNNGSMYIKLMTTNEFAEEKLRISSLHDINYNMILPIKATPHLYRSIFDCNNEIKISTHGHANVFDLIENVKQMSVEKHFVQYDASGSRKTTKLPLSMWYDVCLNLIKTFYGQDNIVKQRLQFNASKFGGEIPNLAFWLTDNLKDIKNGIFSIITDYNSEDHLVFLNHIVDANQRSDSYDHKGRILVVYPCPNIILNVRFTKSTELYDVEVELTKGECDIRNLLLVNEILVRNRNFTYANIVAAPNFVKDEESLACAGCRVMDKTIMKDKSRLEKWFESIIGEISEHEKTFDKLVCETGYLKLISQIFGFLATRRSNKHGASILGLDASKQMRSLMLNAEQLKVLYSEERKKIIVGNFGSGKTLVGSYQLQYLAENAVEKTKIYYICWDSRSMLVQDIKIFIRSLSTKKCACVHAVTVVDLCKELKLTNQPSLPYLISQLLKEHGGDWLMHFIVDEYDCEELSHDVARDLCNTMKLDILKDSFVTILPHSAKRNRTLISSDEMFHHEKYQYEATEMKIFYLSKCMRTTKRNYQLIKRFEQRLCDQKIHFKHPRQPQENRTLEKHTSNESSDARMSDMTSISMLPMPQTSSELPIFPNNNPIFEASLDLDTIAAVQPNTPVNPNMATITQLETRK